MHEGRGVVNTRIAEADAACDIIMKYEKRSCFGLVDILNLPIPGQNLYKNKVC